MHEAERFSLVLFFLTSSCWKCLPIKNEKEEEEDLSHPQSSVGSAQYREIFFFTCFSTLPPFLE